MSQHPEGDTARAAPHHTGEPPSGVAAPDPHPGSAQTTRPARPRLSRRWWIIGGLTLVLAVPVGIGVAAAGGSSSVAPGTGSVAQTTTGSCPAACSTGSAGGMAQHMRQMPYDPADMAEHGKNMMGGGAMMGVPTAAPSSP